MEPTGAQQAPKFERWRGRLSVVILFFSLNVRSYRKFALPALSLVAFAGLAFAYLYSIAPKFNEFLSSVWVSPQRQDTALSHPRPRVASLPPDGLADIPRDFRQELMTLSSLSHAEFSRGFRRPIDKACDYLNTIKPGSFTTKHNPVSDGQWVCSSDVLPAIVGSTVPSVSSIFVWLRGTELREIELFRLKVNLTDPASSGAAKSQALELLEKFHTFLGWDMPVAVQDAIREVKDTSIEIYGIYYQVTREWSSLPRLNVVIHVDNKSGIIPTDTFSVSGAGTMWRKRPAPGPARLLKPSFTLPINPANRGRPEPGPIENLMR